jgi:glucokinase
MSRHPGPSSGAAVGVDVGGSFIKAVRREADGAVVRRASVGTPDSGAGIITTVLGLAEGMGPVEAVGVGMAGLVDHSAGRLVWGPHLPHAGLEVAGALTSRLGVPVVVDNDANLAALAESHVGAGAGYRDVVVVTLGTGIGVGICSDGEIRRGRGHAGEGGHLTVDAGSPRTCVCGRRGCWETLVSGRVLDELARALHGPDAAAADLVAAARSGDAGSIGALRDAGEVLGRGLEVIVLLLDPDVIVVGGAGAGAGDLLLDPARRWLRGTEGADHREPTPVLSGKLGADAGAIGAALAAQGRIHARDTP